MAKFITIGERIHCISPVIREAMATRNPEPILQRGREQLQAGLAPAGGPRGLPDGSQLGPTAPARPRAHAAAPGMSQLQGAPQGLRVNIVTRALPGVAAAHTCHSRGLQGAGVGGGAGSPGWARAQSSHSQRPAASRGGWGC